MIPTMPKSIVRGATITAIALVMTATLLLLNGTASQRRVISVGSIRVDLSDLDPSTHTGADRALRRIRSAAERSCDASSAQTGMHRPPGGTDCFRDTVDQAVEEAGPIVAQHHDAGRFSNW
jgi:UrcA family protein